MRYFHLPDKFLLAKIMKKKLNNSKNIRIHAIDIFLLRKSIISLKLMPQFKNKTFLRLCPRTRITASEAQMHSSKVGRTQNHSYIH